MGAVVNEMRHEVRKNRSLWSKFKGGAEPSIDPATVKRVATELHEFDRNMRALQDRRRELVASYPNQWVGLRKGQVVIVSKDRKEFLEKLQSDLHNDPTIAVSFLSTESVSEIPSVSE